MAFVLRDTNAFINLPVLSRQHETLVSGILTIAMNKNGVIKMIKTEHIGKRILVRSMFVQTIKEVEVLEISPDERFCKMKQGESISWESVNGWIVECVLGETDKLKGINIESMIAR